MIVLYVFIVLLCIVLMLVLSVLFIPFVYGARAVYLDEKKISFYVYWLFGLIRFSGTYDSHDGYENRVHILGFSKIVKMAGKKKEEKAKKKKKKKKRKKRNISLDGFRYLFSNIKKAIIHILPDNISGHGRIGFDNPHITVIAAMTVESIKCLCGSNTDLDFDFTFDEEIYEGRILISGRIFIIYFAYIAARIYLNKSAREMVFN